MIIHEYQGKELMNEVGIPTTKGSIIAVVAVLLIHIDKKAVAANTI